MADASARLAHTILGENLNVRKGESVLIESWTHSLPYAKAFVEEARRLGARPTVLYEDETAWWNSVGKKKYDAVGALSDAERAAIKAADVYVYFWGPEDRPRAENLPDKAREKTIAYNEEWYNLAEKAGLRGVRMTVAQATDPVAKTFGFDGSEWRDRLVAAGGVDALKMRRVGHHVADRLKSGSKLRIRHSNGTDLTLQLRGVKTRVESGVVDKDAMKTRYRMLTYSPAGQVMASVDDSRTEGTFVSNRAVYLGTDKYDGFRWTFRDGRLVEHSEGSGGKEFVEAYDKAPKGKDRLGYLSIGLNPKCRELAPCEDTEEGAILVGIGNNQAVGGKVKIPFIGYSMIGGARIEVDGKLLADRGRVSG